MHAPFARRLTVAAMAGVVLVMPLAGCSSAPQGKKLTVAATVEPQTLDLTAAAPVAPAQALLYNVYETLVKIDGEGKIQPMLATSYDLSADRTTYTFHLDPKATFASGNKVTADAVVKNVARIKAGTGIAAKFSASMKVVDSATAVDDTTVQIKLSRPSNTWLYSMGDTVGMIADPAGFADLATKTAGSGPYQLSGWQHGDSIVLSKNAKYWGAAPTFDTVTFKYFADPNAMNAALLGGTVDIISNEQAPDALQQFSDTSRFTISDGTSNGEVTMGLNDASPALQDVRVRQAITMAIDKKKILDTVEAGHGKVLGTMDVPTDPYYEDLSGVNAYNPDGAKKLLAEAGATNLTLRFKPAALPYASTASQLIAADLKAVGINATISEQQFPAAWSDVVYKQKDYDLTLVNHAEARDLVTYTNPNYYWNYNNPTFTADYTAADQGSPEEYAPAMKKAAHELADTSASVWLYMMPNLVVTKAGVTGFPKNSTTDSFDITGVKAG